MGIQILSVIVSVRNSGVSARRELTVFDSFIRKKGKYNTSHCVRNYIAWGSEGQLEWSVHQSIKNFI